MSEFLSRRRANGLIHFSVISLTYGLLIAVVTWPTINQLTTHMPGTSTDALLHYWNGWWVRTALTHRQSPYFTTLLFYPTGVSLVTHNIAWLNILPWLLVSPWLGGIRAYNIIILGTLLLCGWSAYVLAKRLTHSSWSAYLAGVIYITWPNRISQLDHPNLIATYIVPIFMLGVVNLVERCRWRDVILTGFAFAMVGYSRWQLLIPVTFMSLTYTLLRIRDWYSLAHRRILVFRTFVAAVIGMALLLPPSILLATESLGEEGIPNVFNDNDELIMQTDLLAYVTPPGSNPLLGDWSQPLYDRYYPDRSFDRRYPAYVGLIALSLMSLALWRHGRISWPWLGTGIVLVSLASGPVLRIGGEFHENAITLYRLLAPLRFVRLIRVPDRFNIFLALPVAMLAAIGFGVWLSIWKERFSKHGRIGPMLWTGILVGLVTAEYSIIPVRAHDISYDKSFFTTIAAEPGDFAVLNLPFRRGKSYMFDQTFHTRPIVQGNASRLPGDAYAFVYKNTWLTALRDTFAYPPPVGDVGQQLERLADDGIGYIILHKEELDMNLIAHWKRYLVARPRYEDEHVAIYSTKPEVDRDVLSLHEPVDGLSLVAKYLPFPCLNPGQTLGIGAAWANTKPLSERYEVMVSLVGSEGTTTLSDQFKLTDLEPNENWYPQTIGQGYYPLHVDPELSEGQYDLRLQLIRIPQDILSGESWSIGDVRVQSNPCRMLSAEAPFAINAAFGNALFLKGFALDQEDRQLTLTLDWMSLAQMEENYKIFVHLTDPGTGLIVSQVDTMPNNWLYPTSMWWSGQEVVDAIILDLHGISAGTYLLSVGVYVEGTGERLQIVGANDLQSSEGALLLPVKIQTGAEAE